MSTDKEKLEGIDIIEMVLEMIFAIIMTILLGIGKTLKFFGWVIIKLLFKKKKETT